MGDGRVLIQLEYLSFSFLQSSSYDHFGWPAKGNGNQQGQAVRSSGDFVV